MGVAETWLAADVTDGEVSIPHYKLFRKDRALQHGGGVCIYCHETTRVKQRADLETDLEILWIEIMEQKHSTLVGCAYRPPDKSVAYWDVFQANIEKAMQGRQSRTVLIGDFNVDYADPLASRASHLHSTLTHCNLFNHVSQPTRVTSSSASVIDLFLSNVPIEGVCRTVYVDMSDHFAILAHMPGFGMGKAYSGHPAAKRQGRRLHRINWNTFNEDLNHHLATCTFTGNLENAVQSLTTFIISTLDVHAPLIHRRRQEKRPCPWLTPELVAAVREQNQFHRRLMSDKGNADLRELHRQARSTARKLDRRLRNAYFMNQCATRDQRKLWSVMNIVTGRAKQRQEPQADIVDLSKTFGDVVHDPDRPSTLTPPSGPMPASSFLQFELVPVSDVKACLKCINPAKATGSDCVPGLVLRECADSLAGPLTDIINGSLSTGTVPMMFKRSFISPLYKSGDPTVPVNYRPVSLLPIISRILEHFVKKQLVEYLTAHELYPKTQFAYRKCHSTEDALVLAVNRWVLARSHRRFTGIVMVDMSKAFDRVQHERLVSELHSLGISSSALQLFCSYLTERSQQVRIANSVSSSVHCSRGVPQGSVLGPLLFVLYTRHLDAILPEQVIHQEFADDIILEFSDSDLNTVCRQLSAAATSVSRWLAEIGLLLNAKKTQVMVIQPRGQRAAIPDVFCGQDALKVTPTSKYLGVVIDCELSWKQHVDNVTKRTAQTIGQLWRHGRALSLSARRSWFISIISSHLCYASTAFYPCLTVQLLDRLVKIFKSGIRAVFQVPSTTPSSPLLCRLDLLTLTQIYKQKLLFFVHRCLGTEMISSLFSTFFDLVNGRATRGQASRLLRVPFLPGPSGRSTVQFIGSVYWNCLPPDVRSITILSAFKKAITNDILNSLTLS